jgi:hypothetical protein
MGVDIVDDLRAGSRAVQKLLGPPPSRVEFLQRLLNLGFGRELSAVSFCEGFLDFGNLLAVNGDVLAN